MEFNIKNCTRHTYKRLGLHVKTIISGVLPVDFGDFSFVRKTSWVIFANNCQRIGFSRKDFGKPKKRLYLDDGWAYRDGIFLDRFPPMEARDNFKWNLNLNDFLSNFFKRLYFEHGSKVTYPVLLCSKTVF